MRMLVIAAALVSLAHAQPRYDSDDTHAAIRQASAVHGVSEGFLDCIVFFESTYRPYAVGLAGEEGAVQLHPLGMGRTFRARGYTDPFNPYQAVDFLAASILEGQGAQWAGWRACIAR